MYRIISQYSKYFSVNSLNHPLKINVRLKRMFNMLWFEYFAIMVGNIYQMYYMKSHWWWFLLLYSNIPITWLSESILAKKQFSSIRILSVIWISFSGTDKICLFTTVKLHEGQDFVPCIRSGNKRGTKSWKIDTILYYSCMFNMLIINIIEVELFLLLLSIVYCAIYW